VAEFFLSASFARELKQWEKTASPHDVEALDRAMAETARDPALPGRFRSFYSPSDPTFLYRFANVIIHYRVTARGAVEFLNLFPR
jgi:hypothetical protein